MNNNEFFDAINSFDAKGYNQTFRPYEDMREDFVKQFSVANIRKMDIDEYVIGKQSKDSFCYKLERTLAPLGKIVGAPASKFGIYYSDKTGKYRITKTWAAKSVEESFEALKEELIQLIEAGKREDLNIIRAARISPMFKGKILSTYFPEKYLNVFSEDHLDYFIHFLELDHMIKGCGDIFDKRNVLLEFKNNNSTMATWSLHAFAHFLYMVYPKVPKEGDEIGSYYQGAEMIYGDFISFNDEKAHNSTKYKADYDAQNKAKKMLGERGEYVVMQFEHTKVQKMGLRKKPKQLSIEDDSLGYDIVSYDETGAQIQIEVKATNLTPKDFHFYFTCNELEAARYYKSSYHVYVVFKPHSANPLIYDMGNPFMGKDKVKLIPIAYKINVQKM